MNPDVYRGPWGGANCRDSPVQTDRSCSCQPGQCMVSNQSNRQTNSLPNNQSNWQPDSQAQKLHKQFVKQPVKQAKQTTRQSEKNRQVCSEQTGKLTTPQTVNTPQNNVSNSQTIHQYKNNRMV